MHKDHQEYRYILQILTFCNLFINIPQNLLYNYKIQKLANGMAGRNGPAAPVLAGPVFLKVKWKSNFTNSKY